MEGCTLHQLKSKVPQTGQVFIFGGGGEGVLWTNPYSWLHNKEVEYVVEVMGPYETKLDPKSHFIFGGGGVYSGPTQIRSPNLSDNFHFGVNVSCPNDFPLA